MESHTLHPYTAVMESNGHNFRYSIDCKENEDENDENENDDSSRVMEEYLQAMMNRPLDDTLDLLDDDEDDNNDINHTISLEIDIDLNDVQKVGGDKYSQQKQQQVQQLNDISRIIFQDDESIESVSSSSRHCHCGNETSLVVLKLSPSNQSHLISSSVNKGSMTPNNNKQLVSTNRDNNSNNSSSSSNNSIGSTDDDDHQQNHSDHTCPETPPTPLSCESLVVAPPMISVPHIDIDNDDDNDNTTTASSPQQQQRQPPHDSPLNNDNDSTPIYDTRIHHGNTSSSSSSPTLIVQSNRSKFNSKYDSSIRTSMSYNPITSHSPQRKSASRRQRATMGMSIFSCLDGGDTDDVLSDSEQIQKHRNVFRQRTVTATSSRDNDNDEDDISTCDSEMALELAAHIIRSQLLQNEMLTVAAEAEMAANAGMDRFTRHPMAGVVQDDLQQHRTGTTTKTNHNFDTNNNSHRNSQQQNRKLSIQAMRRSMSEGSYIPQPPRLHDRNKSFVSNIFPESIIPVSSVRDDPSKNAIALRDVNEVFPSFQSFHSHLRTHFHRRDIAPTQLLFQDQNDTYESYISTTMNGVDDCSDYSAQKSTPPTLHPFCKSDDTPLGAVFILPLCSSEVTSTPLTSNRKLVVDDDNLQQQQHLPYIDATTSVPMNTFLQNFRFVDQWSHAISTHCRSNINQLTWEAPVPSHCNQQDISDDDDDDDAFLINVLSQQVTASSDVLVPQIPRKIDLLPGLEHDCISHVIRQTTIPSTIRLQPKINTRHFSHENDTNIVSFVESLSSPFKLAYGIDDPKALFDETEYDSDEDNYDDSIIKSDQEVKRISGEPISSLNSLLDDPALRWTPIIGDPKIHSSSTNVVSDFDAVVATVPQPPSIPDFITPAQLRKIRGIVRRTASNGSVTTVVDAIPANLFYPTKPTPQGVKNLTQSNGSVDTRNDECKTSFETEQPLGPTLSDIYVIEEFAELEVSIVQDESMYLENPVENDESLKESLTLNDLTLSSLQLQKEALTAATCFENDLHKRKIGDDYTVGIVDCHAAISKSDPSVVKWLKDAPTLASYKAPNSCRSLDGYVAKTPFHHDCGCLSLSHASSTCSDDDDVRRSDTITHDGMFSTNAKSMRKLLLSDAITSNKSWDAFLEKFQVSAAPNYVETSNDSTSKGKSTIRDAMSILSSTLSPLKCNDSTAQETQRRDQELRVLQTQVKENDEFMSNFLYCSNTSIDDADDVTESLMNVDATATPNADGIKTSSFLCLDGGMTCGETDSGYCCNSFFDGALTMGNIFLPASFFARSNRPMNDPKGIAHSHRRVRSSINLGVIPGSRRESYHSERTSHHNSSSWLDIANDLDGAFDTWVLGENIQTQLPNVDETDTCLLHVSFQPPTLKNLQGIREGNSNDCDDSDGDDDDRNHNEIATVGLFDDTIRRISSEKQTN